MLLCLPNLESETVIRHSKKGWKMVLSEYNSDFDLEQSARTMDFALVLLEYNSDFDLE